MNKKGVLSGVDHTLLKQIATWGQIEKLCREDMEYSTAPMYILSCYVKQAKGFMGGKLAICAVIGFPNGNMTTAAKMFETEDAVKNGMDETDTVINIGLVKVGHYDQVLNEIRQIKVTCGGKCLKVIIETYLLTEEKKEEMCRVVTESGADFIKTSTRFSMAGATPEDMTLMRKCSGPEVKVKVVDGITPTEDAERSIRSGTDRLGTSRLIP